MATRNPSINILRTTENQTSTTYGLGPNKAHAESLNEQLPKHYIVVRETKEMLNPATRA